MATTVAIPWLVGEAVDAVGSGERERISVIASAIIIVSLVRLVLTVGRRVIAGRVSLGVEYDLRETLYGHLQTLELAFFDRQRTGELISRATVDLAAVRFFLGYGLIFLTQSALTILLAGVAMAALDPALAAIALAPTPLVVLAAYRYGVAARPTLQEVQERIAELTAEVEENISGVRVVKGFAREGAQLERFRGSVERLFERSLRAAQLRALFNPLLGFLPSLGLAAVLLVGGRGVIAGHLTTGEFAAFYAYLLMLSGPMRTLGTALGMGQRAVAAGRRLYEVLDRAPSMDVSPDAVPIPDGPGAVTLRGVTTRYTPEAEEAPAAEQPEATTERSRRRDRPSGLSGPFDRQC
jgi:ATP-binding cassette subfamily B protein